MSEIQPLDEIQPFQAALARVLAAYVPGNRGGKCRVYADVGSLTVKIPNMAGLAPTDGSPLMRVGTPLFDVLRRWVAATYGGEIDVQSVVVNLSHGLTPIALPAPPRTKLAPAPEKPPKPIFDEG